MASPRTFAFALCNSAYLPSVVDLIHALGPTRCAILAPLRLAEAHLYPDIGLAALERQGVAVLGRQDLATRFPLVLCNAEGTFVWDTGPFETRRLREVGVRTLLLSHNTAAAPGILDPSFDAFLALHRVQAEAALWNLVGSDPRGPALAASERRRLSRAMGGVPVVAYFPSKGTTLDSARAFVRELSDGLHVLIKPHPDRRNEFSDEQWDHVHVAPAETTSHALLQVADAAICESPTPLVEALWSGVPWISVRDRLPAECPPRARVIADTGPVISLLRPSEAAATVRAAIACPVVTPTQVGDLRRIVFERHVAISGPYHLEPLAHITRASARARALKALGSNADERPWIIVFESPALPFCAEVLESLQSLAQAFRVLLKPRVPTQEGHSAARERGLDYWSALEMNPNLLRASADFVLAHPESSTVCSAILARIRCIPVLFSKSTFEHELSHAAGFEWTFAPTAAMGGCMSILDGQALGDRLQNTRFWPEYDSAMERVRRQHFGISSLAGHIHRAAELIDRFASTGDFGAADLAPYRPWAT